MTRRDSFSVKMRLGLERATASDKAMWKSAYDEERARLHALYNSQPRLAPDIVARMNALRDE
jgi:hypothetical protein